MIEIDGDTHDVDADKLRDARLEKLGYRTIRFTNSDVMSNIGGVLGLIAETLAALPDRWPHPNASPKGEGLTDLE